MHAYVVGVALSGNYSKFVRRYADALGAAIEFILLKDPVRGNIYYVLTDELRFKFSEIIYDFVFLPDVMLPLMLDDITEY